MIFLPAGFTEQDLRVPECLLYVRYYLQAQDAETARHDMTFAVQVSILGTLRYVRHLGNAAPEKTRISEGTGRPKTVSIGQPFFGHKAGRW
jgi:hypothetical protein